MTLHEQKIMSNTPITEAGDIWLLRLYYAGLGDDIDNDDDNDEDAEMARNEQRHHSLQTISSYRTAITLFARWLERQGRMHVGDIALDDLVHYTRVLRRRDYDLSHRRTEQPDVRTRLSPRTVRSYTRPLLGFLALLESFDAISFRSEAVRAEMVRVLPRLPDALAPTPPDLRRLVTYYDTPQHTEDRTLRLQHLRLRNAALLHMLFSSGARISEVLGLDIANVYRDRRVLSRVRVYGKGRREETIFLRKSAEHALATYLAARNYPPAEEPLFISYDRRTAGSRLTRSSGWRIVRHAANEVANILTLVGKYDEADMLRTTSPHTFRHFVGYYLLNEGADLAEVSQILRHRNVEVTRNFYARYRDIQLQEVHDQFSPDPLGENNT